MGFRDEVALSVPHLVVHLEAGRLQVVDAQPHRHGARIVELLAELAGGLGEHRPDARGLVVRHDAQRLEGVDPGRLHIAEDGEVVHMPVGIDLAPVDAGAEFQGGFAGRGGIRWHRKRLIGRGRWERPRDEIGECEASAWARPRAQSPVGVTLAASIMSTTVRWGARVRWTTPRGTRKVCFGRSATTLSSRSRKSSPSTT